MSKRQRTTRGQGGQEQGGNKEALNSEEQKNKVGWFKYKIKEKYGGKN